MQQRLPHLRQVVAGWPLEAQSTRRDVMQPTARLAVSHYPYGHFGTVGSRWLHAEGLAALDAPPMGGDGGNQLPSSLVLAQRHGRNVQLDLHGVGQSHQRQAASFQQCFQRLFITREAQPEVVG